MQTRNKKYCVNSNTLKSKENQKDECLRLSESSEVTALKDLENKENMQIRSVLQSKENHLPGKVTSLRRKVRNEIIKIGKRSALKSKENNLNEKSPTFSVIDNYDSIVPSKGIPGKNEENKENAFINNSLSKSKENKNGELPKRTLPLRRKGKVLNLMATLNRKETVKESKYEDRTPELRLKSTESELNNKNQDLNVRETSKINNPLLPETKLLVKLTASKSKECKLSDLRKMDNEDVSKLNENLESCREKNKICDEKTSVAIEDDSVRASSTGIRNKNISGSNTEESNLKKTASDKDMNETPNSVIESTEANNVEKPVTGNKGDTLSIRASSTRTRSRKNILESCTQESNTDITVSDKISTRIRSKNISGSNTEESNHNKNTGLDKNLSKKNEVLNSGIESTEAKNVEKPAIVNKGDTLSMRAPSTRLRSKKNNSGSSTQESSLNTTISDKNVSKMDEKSNLGIESTEGKNVEKPSFVGKGNILPKRTQSARIKSSKKANSVSNTELSNIDGKTIISSVKHIGEESEIPKSRRENKELKGNKKIVLSKSDTMPKKTSERIRSKKVNTERVSQQSNHNGNAIISNKNIVKNKTPDEKTPVVETNILPNRTPSERIRNHKTNSEETVSNDSGKKLQISENLSNQSKSQVKVPVWKCKEVKKSTESNSPKFDFKTKRRSNRVSLSSKRDVYEFSFEGNEKFVVKKKRRKQQVRKKKLKPLKKGLLTTDPLFEPTIPCITTKTFYSSKITKPSTQKPSNEIYNENHENNFSDGEDTNLDITVDDAGYEASISVAESSCMTHINPVASALPTPKIYSAFLGPASTPIAYDERYGYNSILRNKDIAPQEEVKLCFGFDESDNENSLGLSPVQNLNQFSHLQQSSIASYNFEEIESAPTRFTLPTFKKPLPLMNGKENTQQKLKKRCTSTKINHAKRRKLDKNSLVPDKDSLPPQAQDTNVSVLFDIEDEEVPVELNTYDISSKDKRGELKMLQLPLKIPENNVSILFDKENEAPSKSNSPTDDVLNQNKSGILRETQFSKILSPEKSFSKPPRKSYDRKSLEAAKKKLIEEFAGGYPTTDTGSDYEDPDPPYVRKRKKRMESQKENIGDNSQSKFQFVSKRANKKPCKKNENKEKQLSNSTVNTKPIHKRKKPPKNQSKPEDDWVSDINSHFSEIEDMDLLIE